MNRIAEMEKNLKICEEKAKNLHKILQNSTIPLIRNMVVTQEVSCHVFQLQFSPPINYSYIGYDSNDNQINIQDKVSKISVGYPFDAKGLIESMLINTKDDLIHDSLNRYSDVNELIEELIRLQN